MADKDLDELLEEINDFRGGRQSRVKDDDLDNLLGDLCADMDEALKKKDPPITGNLSVSTPRVVTSASHRCFPVYLGTPNHSSGLSNFSAAKYGFQKFYFVNYLNFVSGAVTNCDVRNVIFLFYALTIAYGTMIRHTYFCEIICLIFPNFRHTLLIKRVIEPMGVSANFIMHQSSLMFPLCNLFDGSVVNTD